MARVNYADMKLKHNFNLKSPDELLITTCSGVFVFDGEKVSRNTLETSNDGINHKVIYCGTCGRLIDEKMLNNNNNNNANSRSNKYNPNGSYFSTDTQSIADTRTVGTLENDDTVSMITNDDRLIGLKGYVKSYIPPKGPKTMTRYKIGPIKEHGDPEKLENNLPHVNKLAKDEELVAKDFACNYCGHIQVWTGSDMPGIMTSWQKHELQIQKDIGTPLYINYNDDLSFNGSSISTVTSGFSRRSYSPHIDESPEYAASLLVFGYHNRNKKKDDKILDMQSPKYKKFLQSNIPRGSTKLDHKEVLCNNFQRILQKSDMKLKSIRSQHTGYVYDNIPKGSIRPLYLHGGNTQDRPHFINTSKTKHISRLKIYDNK